MSHVNDLVTQYGTGVIFCNSETGTKLVLDQHFLSCTRNVAVVRTPRIDVIASVALSWDRY